MKIIPAALRNMLMWMQLVNEMLNVTQKLTKAVQRQVPCKE